MHTAKKKEEEIMQQDDVSSAPSLSSPSQCTTLHKTMFLLHHGTLKRRHMQHQTTLDGQTPKRTSRFCRNTSTLTDIQKLLVVAVSLLYLQVLLKRPACSIQDIHKNARILKYKKQWKLELLATYQQVQMGQEKARDAMKLYEQGPATRC